MNNFAHPKTCYATLLVKGEKKFSVCENEILNFSQWASFWGLWDKTKSFFFQRQRINALKFLTESLVHSVKMKNVEMCVWKERCHNFSCKNIRTHTKFLGIQSYIEWNLRACNLKCKFSRIAKLEFRVCWGMFKRRRFNPKGHITFKCFTSFLQKKFALEHFFCVLSCKQRENFWGEKSGH